MSDLNLCAAPIARGRIEVITGSMWAGKSSELIRRIQRAEIAKKAVQVFKSQLDNRYAGLAAVSTHCGKTKDGVVAVREAHALLTLVQPETPVVAIDEVQFLGDDVIAVVNTLARAGHRVIVAGISTDFRGEPFGPMPALMAIADDVTILKAICVRCGEDAIRTQRLVGGQPAPASAPLIQVGSDEGYEARCRQCHQVAA